MIFTERKGKSDLIIVIRWRWRAGYHIRITQFVLDYR